MIFLSSGHNAQSTTVKPDPGAIANGVKEGDLTIELKALIQNVLKKKGVSYISDTEEETLSAYLKRIKPGPGSVVLELHFDSFSSTSSGCTALVGDDSNQFSKNFAHELASNTALTLGIKNRGVVTEKMSARGRLALMRKPGIVSLLEVAFISNKYDLANYKDNKHRLAEVIADILIRYENLIP